jgi:signal transduction histidine kinase
VATAASARRRRHDPVPPAPAGESAADRRLRVLLAEDSEDDAFLVTRELKRGGYQLTVERVQTRETMRAALRQASYDVVISDYSMPGFDAVAALAVLRDSGLDLPFIVVSGTAGEASAVSALKAGAHDFIVKGNLARLAPAIERERRDAGLRAERRKMEAQLLASDRMASVGMLAAGVAHEINNPLAAVLANLYVIREVLGDLQAFSAVREACEAAADAMAAAERVRQIVRDVKIFSRGSEERLVPVDVHRVLDSTVRMAWNDIRHRANLVRHFGRINAVLGSEQRLGQVFLNLVVNAAQAIPEGRAQDNEIRLATFMERGRVVIEVSDTGAGIPAEIRARLFSPFVTTKPPGQGTGLGLSISRRIVTALGGEIGVDSEPGRGTTFRVSLPASDELPITRESSTDLAAFGDLPRSRILVVDDEVMVTNAIRRSIGTAHDVVVVFQAREALRRVQEGERFDVILCDLLMPEMTGIQLHQAITEVAPAQAERMLFMTGGTFTSEAAAFVDTRPDRVLDKPFDKPALMAALATRLR